MTFVEIALGVLIYILFVVVLKNIVVICVPINNSFNSLKQIGNCFLSIVLFILSFDYWYVQEIKKELFCSSDVFRHNTNKGCFVRVVDRKTLITGLNNHNLILSTILLLFLYSASIWAPGDFISDCWVGRIFSVIILYRFISRTLEVNISFIGDVVEQNKNRSKLSCDERIKLAFKSLFEEVILFASVYCLILNSHELCVVSSLYCGLHSFIMQMPSLSMFKCVNSVFGGLQYLRLYQVFSSIVLITISFAVYISNKK